VRPSNTHVDYQLVSAEAFLRPSQSPSEVNWAPVPLCSASSARVLHSLPPQRTIVVIIIIIITIIVIRVIATIRFNSTLQCGSCLGYLYPHNPRGRNVAVPALVLFFGLVFSPRDLYYRKQKLFKKIIIVILVTVIIVV